MKNLNFQTLLVFLVFEKAQKESGYSKTRTYQYISDETGLDLRTIKELYKKRVLNLHETTLNELSKFLEFRSFKEFRNGNRNFLNQLIEKQKKAIFRNKQFLKDGFLQKAFKEITNDYRLFSFKTGEIIKYLYPNIREPEILHLYDFITLKPNTTMLEYGFIIIDYSFSFSFEKFQLQLEAILNSLKNETKKPLYLNIYANMILTYEEMNIVQSIIKNYIDENNIEDIEFYDIEEIILDTGIQLASMLQDTFSDKNNFFRKQALQISETTSYYSNVPFNMTHFISNIDNLDVSFDWSETKFNPSAFIKEELLDDIDPIGILENHIAIDSDDMKLSRKTGISFIISEFGFGKTSLLLHLTSIVPNIYNVLFLPVNQLRENSFESIDSFIKEIYSILYNGDYNQSEIIELLKFRYLKGFLLKKQNVILFFDGLDEHISSYSFQGLKKILNCLESLEADCIISVRKEFWDDRNGDLSSLLRSSNKYGALILKEWSIELVMDYIEYYQETKKYTFNPNLEKLKGLIKNRNYSTLYGDIPKRPLFLNMIIEDTISNKLEKRTLNELVKSYLIKKFIRDREGGFKDGKTGRQLRMEETFDRTKIIQILWDVLKIAVEKTIVIKNNELLLTPYISESTIETIISKLGYDLKIREILMNSVLISFSKRTFDSELMLYFAHKSFQEYYLALLIKEGKITLTPEIKLPEGVIAFL